MFFLAYTIAEYDGDEDDDDLVEEIDPLIKRHEEVMQNEVYRTIDSMNSHIGNLDNRTNSIIEQIAEELHDEFTVSQLNLDK